MESVEVQELLSKNLTIVQSLEKKASAFGKGMLVISILDVLFGVLAIFCTTLQFTALFASVTSLTAITIFGRVIQVNKIKQVEKGLRTLDLVAIAWFVNKYKKHLKEKQKMTKMTILQKVLTSILAVFGVGGIVVGIFPTFLDISEYVTNIVSAISEGIAVVSGIWLATTSDAVLTDEEVATLEAEEKAKKKAEAQALLDKYEEAKKIVSEE